MTTGNERSGSRALLYLLPSARDLIFIFLFGSVLAGTLSNRPLADPDIGWHIRTGEQILATHSLPRTDPYSSTMLGQPWFAWEWLYDLLLGVLHHFGGLNGVVWLCALIVASTFTILLTELLKRGSGLLLGIALMLLAECASVIHLFARPHIVSWLFVLLWFMVLERWAHTKNVPDWLPWFFPFSMLLWVNLHGSWILGLALLGIYVVSLIVEGYRCDDPFIALRKMQRARSMAWIWLLSALVTFVNPYTWHLHVHIYRYLADPYLMDHIAEFRSPNFHQWPVRCFGFILLLTLFAFLRLRRPLRLSDFLIAVLCIWAGLHSARNLPIAAMLLVLIIAPMLSEDFAALAIGSAGWQWLRSRAASLAGFSQRMTAQELQLRGHLWPALCVVAALLISINGGRLGSRPLLHAHFDSKSVPVAAVDFLANEQNSAPVFSTDSWGGYLIYRLYPQRLVVVDDRHDLYGSHRIEQLLVLMQGEPGWRDVLENLHPNTVLLPADSTLASLLREMPKDWTLSYQDQFAVVFERRLPAAD